VDVRWISVITSWSKSMAGMLLKATSMLQAIARDQWHAARMYMLAHARASSKRV
jgi:hypothetical protein